MKPSHSVPGIMIGCVDGAGIVLQHTHISAPGPDRVPPNTYSQSDSHPAHAEIIYGNVRLPSFLHAH